MEDAPGSVLVVDDSPTKRYVLVSWLTRAGFQVTEAQTGAEAMERISAGGVELVVLDVRLPDVSGFEVCEWINAEYPSVAVIHVSAHAVDVGDRAQGLTRGADAYLAEPIEPEELIATAKAVLRYYRARHRAELLARRMVELAHTTLAINSAASFQHLLSEAALGAAKIFRTPAVVVAETVEGESLAGAAAGPDAVPFVQPWTMGDEVDLPLGSTVRIDKSSQWSLLEWPDGDQITVAAARLRRDRAVLYVAVPTSVQMPGQPVLVQLAQAVAAAVEAQRSFDEEHRIAVTLQRSLLPQVVPTVAGLEMAVRYEPASAQTEVGGDFYELVMLDGHLLVAIGDVAGHSLHAATVMAEVRHAVRAYAVEGHQPGAILSRVDELMRTLLPGELATVCIMLVEPETGRVRMASAGHLPPALALAGKVDFLEHRAPLLGVKANRPEDFEFVLPRGATLLLYTDGLIERRDADIDEGLAALAAIARDVDADLERFCERLMVNLVPDEISDDLAVVALRRT